jgi:hypothetical protein
MPRNCHSSASVESAPCHTCPHVRRETPMAISCLKLDGSITCARERIGRHQARLLDPNWQCPHQEK